MFLVVFLYKHKVIWRNYFVVLILWVKFCVRTYYTNFFITCQFLLSLMLMKSQPSVGINRLRYLFLKGYPSHRMFSWNNLLFCKLGMAGATTEYYLQKKKSILPCCGRTLTNLCGRTWWNLTLKQNVNKNRQKLAIFPLR